MDVEISNTESGVLVLRPDVKYLDALHAAGFRQKMIEAAQGSGQLIVNCSDIQYVDSTGLASLVSVFKALAPGGRMALVCMNKDFLVLLEQTMLHKIFPCFDDVQEAVQTWQL